MPKVLSLPKNLKRFEAADKPTLLLLQGFVFGVYNTRLKLKQEGHKFRQYDVLTVLIVGELHKSGCKVGDLRNVLGYQNSVAQAVLTRAKSRGIVYRDGGKRGRGQAAKYYLTGSGQTIYETLQGEMGQTFADAKQALKRNILIQLNRPLPS